jgi:hypothetical protein
MMAEEVSSGNIKFSWHGFDGKISLPSPSLDVRDSIIRISVSDPRGL